MRLTLAQVRKAIVGFVVPALVGLAAALADDVVTAAEWVGIAVAALGTSGGVYLIPNAPALVGPATGPDVKLDRHAVYDQEHDQEDDGLR